MSEPSGSVAEQAIEITLPDLAATDRLAGALAALSRPGDVIGLEGESPKPPVEAPGAALVEGLLQPALREGRLARELPSLSELQQRAVAQMEALPAEVKRLSDPASYPVRITEQLRRLALSLQTR